MNKTSFIDKYNNQIINIPFFSIGFYLQSTGVPVCALSEEEESNLNKIKKFFAKEDIAFVDTVFKNHASMDVTPTFNICFIFLKKNLAYDKGLKNERIYKDYVNKAKRFSYLELFTDFNSLLDTIKEESKQGIEEAIKILGSLFCIKKENIEVEDVKQIENCNEFYKALNFEQFEKIVYPNCILYWNINNPSKEVLYVRKSKTFYFLNNKEYES